MMKLKWACAPLLLLTACGRSQLPEGPVANDTQPAVPAPGTGPNAKTPLAPAAPKPPPPPSLIEPTGPIDPKSIEAAGQVVQHYGALIEQSRWAESRALWSDAEAAKAFERNFRAYTDVHIGIGDLGDAEGAAGSIYVTESVKFYGKKNGGGDYRRPAEATLRRVNDVSGSTDAQRRWHIERIDWKAAD